MGNNGFKPPYKLLLLLPISHFDASVIFLSGQVVKTHAQTTALWGGTAATPQCSGGTCSRADPHSRGHTGWQRASEKEAEAEQWKPPESGLPNTGTQVVHINQRL